MVRVLGEWQHEVGEQYPPSKLRPQIARARKHSDISSGMNIFTYTGAGLPDHKGPPGCEKQDAFYRETVVLTLTSNLQHDESVREAFAAFDPARPASVQRDFLAHIERTWKTNPTMIDLDYENSREKEHVDVNLCHDPFFFGEELVAAGIALRSKSGLLPYLMPFFLGTAEAIQHLGSRLKVEACVGDVTTVLEQIRYGATVHRHPPSPPRAQINNSQGTTLDTMQESTPGRIDEYPTSYDKIHLSNIPDYIGGTLCTVLYALPVLNSGKNCYSTSNCLRNPPRFKPYRLYHNEYVGLSTPADLKRVLHVRADLEDWQTMGNPIPVTEYMNFYHEPQALTSTTRMSHDELRTYLFRMFLKLAIPKDRQPRTYVMIYSPLNLTAFLRLCAHLHDVGYPAHWLSGVLQDICSGHITTKARPPRSEPLAIKEVQKDMPILQQCTAPFVAELTTLLGLWQFALPFGVLSKSIPRLAQVHKYSITFEDVDDSFAEPAHFILILFHSKYLRPGVQSLRRYVLSDELGEKGQKASQIRNNMQIVTTWNWNFDTKTAEFWLRSDMMESLQVTKQWMVQIWRVDT